MGMVYANCPLPAMARPAYLPAAPQMGPVLYGLHGYDFKISLVWKAGQTRGVYTAGPVVSKLGTLTLVVTSLWVVQYFVFGALFSAWPAVARGATPCRILSRRVRPYSRPPGTPSH